MGRRRSGQRVGEKVELRLALAPASPAGTSVASQERIDDLLAELQGHLRRAPGVNRLAPTRCSVVSLGRQIDNAACVSFECFAGAEHGLP